MVCKDFRRAMEVRRFLRAVEHETSDPQLGHVVILYQVACNHQKSFPQMKDPEFRRLALRAILSQGLVDNASFSAPDEYDDWTFSAYRI